MAPSRVTVVLSLALPLLAAACDHTRNPKTPAVAADGARHYATYAAAGEVTDPTGAVNIYAATGANALSATAAA
jgi:hypothetical protein